MKNLVRLQFGPFIRSEAYDEAEKLFKQSGISQRVATANHQGDVLLLILAEEEAPEILEAAKRAGINRYSTK